MALLIRFKSFNLPNSSSIGSSIQIGRRFSPWTVSPQEQPSTKLFSPIFEGSLFPFRNYAKAAIKLKKRNAKKREAKAKKDAAAIATPKDDSIVIRKPREVKEKPPLPHIHIKMTTKELYNALNDHYILQGEARKSWLETMIVNIKNAADFNLSLKMHNLYVTKGVIPSPTIDSLLIKAACKLHLAATALKLLKDVENTRLWPTLNGIHHLINYCSIKRRPDLAEEAFSTIKLRNLMPKALTYYLMMRTHLTVNDIAKAEEWMEKAKADHQVHLGMYNLLLKSLLKAKEVDKALKLRDEMKTNGIAPSNTTAVLTSLLHVAQGNLVHAVEEFKTHVKEFKQELVNSFVNADVGNVKTLFEALKAANVELPGAANMLAKLEQKGNTTATEESN